MQLIFFGVLIFAAPLAAGIIANWLPLSDPPAAADTRHVMDSVEAVNEIAPVHTLAPQQQSGE